MDTATASPKRRARSLYRGKNPDVPLFAPIALAIAAQIEGWDVEDFLGDPSKLTRGVQALHQSMGTDALFVSAASAMEAEAAGATLDWTSYPPRVTGQPVAEAVLDGAWADRSGDRPRIAAALETVRRLRVTLDDEALLAAVVTGPWTLGHQLFGAQWPHRLDAAGERAWEQCSQIATQLAGRFCEAGCHLIVVQEASHPTPESADHARLNAAMTSIRNIVKFHKAPLVQVVTGASDGSDPKVEGRGFLAGGLPPQPEQWTEPFPGSSLLLTTGEIPVDTDIPNLRSACQEVLAHLAKLGTAGKIT